MSKEMRNHIDKFKDFLLNENINMSPIFVWIEFNNIESILKNGIKFKSNDDERYNFKCSISSTRNSKWRWGGGNCRITLDREQISKHFKIVPYSYYGFKEWEERIFSNKCGYLEPIFFKKIEIDKNIYNEDIDIENKYNIPIEILDFHKNRIDAYGGRYILPKI